MYFFDTLTEQIQRQLNTPEKRFFFSTKPDFSLIDSEIKADDERELWERIKASWSVLKLIDQNKKVFHTASRICNKPEEPTLTEESFNSYKDMTFNLLKHEAYSVLVLKAFFLAIGYEMDFVNTFTRPYADSFEKAGQKYWENQDYQNAYVAYLWSARLGCFVSAADFCKVLMETEIKDLGLLSIGLLHTGIDNNIALAYRTQAELTEDGYYGEGKEHEVFNDYYQAYIRGDIPSTVKVAELYFDGVGTTKDIDKAIDILKIALNKNSDDAYVLLGNYYEGDFDSSDDDITDRTKAIECYKKALSINPKNSNAFIDLSICYAYGDLNSDEKYNLIKPNKELALYYANELIKLDSFIGMGLLISFYEDGTPAIEADENEALRYCKILWDEYTDEDSREFLLSKSSLFNKLL